MTRGKTTKLIILIAASLTACLFAFFVDFRRLDVMFVSLFYIPMIMAGIWFHRQIIPLTLLFVALLYILDITKPGPAFWRDDQIFRGFILIAGAFLFYFMGMQLDAKTRQLVQSRQQLAVEKERLRITLLSIGDGVVSTDGGGCIALINGVAGDLAGWPGQSAVGRPFGEVFRLADEYTGEARDDVVAEVLKGTRTEELADHTVLVSRDGRETPVAVDAAPIQGESAEYRGVVLVLRDMTAVKRKQNELEYQNLHDQLTGLGNRRMLEVQAKRLMRENTLPVSVVVGDVNGLKLANDALGHALGDELLVKAAETLRRVVRENDAISRYGGDEFVILMPGTDEDSAAQIVSRVRKAFSEVTVGPVRLSISLGWSVKNTPDADIMDVMREAEDRMYANKLTESTEAKKAIIASMVEKTGIHGEYTKKLCALAAEAFALKGRDARDLKTACMVRDIGRVAVEAAEGHAARRGAGDDEAEKRHAEIGYRILNMVPDYAGVADYVLAHHERWDGAGRPKGLKGEEIPYLSRIVAVVDYADLLSETGKPADIAARLMKHAGTRFDPELARAFAEKVLGSMGQEK